MRPEDAPTVPTRRPTVPPSLPAELPPDPTAVEFDFEPEDLPIEALECIDVTDFEDVPNGSEAVLESEGTPQLRVMATPLPLASRETQITESFSLLGDDDDTDAEDLHEMLEGDVVPFELGSDEGLDPTPVVPDRRPDPSRRLAAQLPQDARNSGPATPMNERELPPPPQVAELSHESRVQVGHGPAPSAAPTIRRASPLRWVPVVFFAAMAATVFLALIPWFTLLSPRLHEAQAAQRAEMEASRQVVQIPTPVPVPVVERVFVPAEATAEGADEPATNEERPTAEPTRRDLALAPRPAASRPLRRVSRPKAPPPPEPEEEEVKPEVEPPKPVAPPKPKPKPEPAAPPEARVLSGRYGGTTRGEPVLFDLDFLANGKVRATIQRGAEPSVSTTGRYALAGDRATIALVEPTEGGASYSGTVTLGKVSGRVSYPNGKNHKFSLDR